MYNTRRVFVALWGLLSFVTLSGLPLLGSPMDQEDKTTRRNTIAPIVRSSFGFDFGVPLKKPKLQNKEEVVDAKIKSPTKGFTDARLSYSRGNKELYRIEAICKMKRGVEQEEALEKLLSVKDGLEHEYGIKMKKPLSVLKPRRYIDENTPRLIDGYEYSDKNIWIYIWCRALRENTVSKAYRKTRPPVYVKVYEITVDVARNDIKVGSFKEIQAAEKAEFEAAMKQGEAFLKSIHDEAQSASNRYVRMSGIFGKRFGEKVSNRSKPMRGRKHTYDFVPEKRFRTFDDYRFTTTADGVLYEIMARSRDEIQDFMLVKSAIEKKFGGKMKEVGNQLYSMEGRLDHSRFRFLQLSVDSDEGVCIRMWDEELKSVGMKKEIEDNVDAL